MTGMDDYGHVKVLNAEFAAVTESGAAARVDQMIANGERGWIATVNVAILMSMRSDARLQSFVDRAALTLADGLPIVWLSRLEGRPLPERVTGVDLVDTLCAQAERRGVGVYLLGASERTIRTVAALMHHRYPALDLHYAHGYFASEDAADRAGDIARSGARLLIVGMGVPRQEHFIEDHWDCLDVDVAIGVGGSFDVLAGVRRRAPRWVQNSGLEWLFRLAQEPRRLLPRYAVTNAQFLMAIAREWASPAPRLIRMSPAETPAGGPR